MLSDDRSALLKTLANETRWRVVQALLAVESSTVGGLTDRLNLQQPAVSKHIKALREVGLLSCRKEGTTLFCSVNLDLLEEREGGKVLNLGFCTFRVD